MFSQSVQSSAKKHNQNESQTNTTLNQYLLIQIIGFEKYLKMSFANWSSYSCNNKIMKALQGQIQYQPQKILHTGSKPKHYQQLLRKTTKLIKAFQHAPIKGLPNFQHRRKYQMPGFKQTVLYSMPRKSQKLENISRLQEKEREVAQHKRHIHHATDFQDMYKEKNNKIQLVILRDFTRKRGKNSVLSQQTAQREEFIKSKSGWKLKEKFNKTKEKTEKDQSQQTHCRTFKHIVKFNENEYSICANSQGGSFLDLIKKFKFQNLKTMAEIDKNLYSPVSRQQARDQKKRQSELPSFRRTFQNVDKRKRSEVTTITNFFHKSKDKARKIIRKMSSLSPWELTEDTQFMGPVQLGKHG